MHVQGQRPHRNARNAREYRIDELLGGECLGEAIGGRIRCVPRPEAVVFVDQRRIERHRRSRLSRDCMQSRHPGIVPAGLGIDFDVDQVGGRIGSECQTRTYFVSVRRPSDIDVN